MGQLDGERVTPLCAPNAKRGTVYLDPAALFFPSFCLLISWLKKEPELIRYHFNRELQREKMWSRIHLIPLLMAESDRKLYLAQQTMNAAERVIMKDVEGWEVRVQDLTERKTD